MMLDTYITKSALLANEVEPEFWMNSPEEYAVFNEWHRWVDKIKNTPAADVMPVVRCCDCEYSYVRHEPCHSITGCICSYLGAYVDKQFFCAHGNKRKCNADETTNAAL